MRRLALAVVFLAFGIRAQTPEERVLLPIYLPFPVPGAYQSLWVSELRLMNAGTETVSLDNLGPVCPVPCPGTPLPPGVSVLGTGVRNLIGNGIPGVLLRVPGDISDQLVFQLRVRDTSRADEGWGTSLPVVRESESPAGPVHLLAIPVVPRYRQMLRVYSFNPAQNQGVVVRIFASNDDEPETAQQPDTLLAQISLPLRVAASVTQPGYAELSDLGLQPGVAGHDLVRVTIEPLGAYKIWALVSVTNNATQEVTGIWPNQPSGTASP